MPDYNFIAGQSTPINPLSAMSTIANIRGQNIANQTNQANLNEDNNMRAYLTDPANHADFTAPDGTIDQNALTTKLTSLAPTKGAAVANQIIQVNRSGIAAKSDLLNLNANSIATVGNAIAAQNPNDSWGNVQNNLNEQKTIAPQASQWIDFVGQHILQPAYQSGNPNTIMQAKKQAAMSTLSLAQQASINEGSRQTGQVGGAQVTNVSDPFSTRPGFISGTPMQGQQPVQQPQSQQQPMQQPVQPPAQGGGISQPSPLRYPVRQAGVPFNQLPSEPADTAAGQQYRSGLVANLPQYTQLNRNIGEVVKQAQAIQDSGAPTTGWLGGASRIIKTGIGNVDYPQLSKDLANVQLASLKASGGDLTTDAGKSLVAHASGDITYPPSVLLDISRRTQADITNAQMQANGAQAFSNKNGDNNMQSFQADWAKNANDSRVFQAKNIIDDTNLSQLQRNQQLLKLYGGDTQALKQAPTRINNLLKLSTTGSLQ